VTEKREASRRRVLKTAFIILSDKAPKIECTIRNLSETGAAVQLSTTVGIPQNFDVIIDGTRRHCRSQWRTDTKIGIMFE
jgi:PilZ domain